MQDNNEILRPRTFILPDITLKNWSGIHMVSGMVGISGGTVCIWIGGKWQYISGMLTVQVFDGAKL